MLAGSLVPISALPAYADGEDAAAAEVVAIEEGIGADGLVAEDDLATEQNSLGGG